MWGAVAWAPPFGCARAPAPAVALSVVVCRVCRSGLRAWQGDSPPRPVTRATHGGAPCPPRSLSKRSPPGETSLSGGGGGGRGVVVGSCGGSAGVASGQAPRRRRFAPPRRVAVFLQRGGVLPPSDPSFISGPSGTHLRLPWRCVTMICVHVLPEIKKKFLFAKLYPPWSSLGRSPENGSNPPHLL